MHTKYPELDRCRCSDCHTTFFTKDLPIEEESEGWEYPTYTVHVCTKCEEGGCIENYYPSSRALREWKETKETEGIKSEFISWSLLGKRI